MRAIRGRWPRVEILIRADSHYCAPEVLDFCRGEGLEFILGVASTTTLHRHVEVLERSTAALRAATPGTEKQRRYKEFLDGAGSWSRVERIIARVEAGPEGVDTRFIVTTLTGGSARSLYERNSCKRGQAENHIKAWKRHLAADRTSCSRATANQFRLVLHTAAYWLLHTLRSLAPMRSFWRSAQLDTIRLALVKVVGQVTELASRIEFVLPSGYPYRDSLMLLAARAARPP